MATVKTQKVLEDSLVMRLKQRESAALEELAQIYRPRLRRIALRLLRSVDDADDVVEDTLLKAYQAIGQYRQTSSLFTWLVSIATNESLMLMRKRKASLLSMDCKPVQLAAEFAHAARSRHQTPEQIVIREELAGMCRQCVGSLFPLTTRTVVVMRLMEDQRNAEIASQLNISMNAVKIRYHRGLRELKRLVRRKMEHPHRLKRAEVHLLPALILDKQTKP